MSCIGLGVDAWTDEKDLGQGGRRHIDRFCVLS